MRHHPPRGARPDNPAEAINDLSQAMLPLGGVFGDQGQVRGYRGVQLPLGQSCWLANAAPSATARILAQPMSG